MASQILYLTGTVKWAKFKTPDDKYKNWTVDFYPDKASLKALKEVGSRLEQKIDDDGTFFRLRRPLEKLIKDELVKFDPPKVVKNTGTVNEQGVPNVEPFDGLIGNGSKGVAKVVFYDAGPYKGHRLEGFRIDELVEYNPEAREPSPDYPF